MAKADYAHRQTDKALAKLEKRIAEVYKEAVDNLSDTIDKYFDSFKKRDDEMREMLSEGKISKEHYKQWRLNQIGRGERYEALRDKLATRYTNANETAISYVNDATPGIYSLNRNYAAYTIEQVSSSADFTLFDEQTVKRLITEQPDLMPSYPKAKAVKRGIDLEYGKQRITATVTSGILQGQSIKSMADNLQQYLEGMNRTSAIRAARTAVTEAQNAGRQDTYTAAAKMGIKGRKMWLATLDGRTRHDHRGLDGQRVDVDKPFEYGGYRLMHPGDGSMGAPGYTLYNCRCTMVHLDELDEQLDPGMRRAIDPETGESVVVPWMTYREWEGQKKSLQQNSASSIIKKKIETGEYSTKISVQKQSRHIQGTKQFEEYASSRKEKGQTPQSVLTVDIRTAQELVDRYCGTGIAAVTKDGKPKDNEFVTADIVIGKQYTNNEYYDTHRMAIHYSKKGVHIVPVSEKSND